MEGLTETGAPNPFICVRPRKREEWGRGGMGLQNATALSPLQTRPPQPSEHETHPMRSKHSSGRIHTHAHTGTHLCIYSMLKCLLKQMHTITVSCTNTYGHPLVRPITDAHTHIHMQSHFRVCTCSQQSMRLSGSAWIAIAGGFSLG